MKILTRDNTLLAYIVRDEELNDGYNFIGSPNNELQVGFNNYKINDCSKPHIHKNNTRVLNSTMEVVHIINGKCEFYFYWENSLISKNIINKGDTVVLLKGGHGLKMLEPTKILEIKQGPYYGKNSDKQEIDVSF